MVNVHGTPHPAHILHELNKSLAIFEFGAVLFDVDDADVVDDVIMLIFESSVAFDTSF